MRFESQNTFLRLVRIVVGEPNANGQIIDKEIFVSEQRNREMKGSNNIQNNNRSISCVMALSNDSRRLLLSG